MQAASDRKTTVFISYRREGGFFLAAYIFEHLHAAGYDVFMDVHNLGAGEFEQTTLAEVAARDYFLLVVTSGSLPGMLLEKDWLRRELMRAVESGKIVVPVLADDVKFEDQEVQEVLVKLPATLQALQYFNAVRIPPPEYFEAAMERLTSFLKPIADFTPSHGTDKSAGTIADESLAQAQSVLHDMTLPPVNSLTKIQSDTPWSDLQKSHTVTGTVGVDALTPMWSPPALARPPAPTLHSLIGFLSWTEVSEADKYVLEESSDAEFKYLPKVVYQGPMRSWVNVSDPSPAPSLLPPVKYYRVKAIGRGAAGESDWSNIIGTRLTDPVAPPRPPAPTLQKGFFSLLKWTEVSGTEKYVLEESSDAEFRFLRKVVYEGPLTSWMNQSNPPLRYYRVKAVGNGAAGESDWSNTICDPPV